MLLMMFLKGLLIGFCIALPFGPIGVMCIQQSLIRGASYGLIAGLGAAIADAIFGALASIGVSYTSFFLTEHQLMFQFAGALFLCIIGIRTFTTHPDDMAISNRITVQKLFASTFFLTITNPITLLCFAGIYAGLGIGLSGEGALATLFLTLGVFVGSALWWVIISFGIRFLKEKISVKLTHQLSRISALVLLLFGVVSSLSVVLQILPT